MRRFIVPSLAVVDGVATLSGDTYRHMATVLRLGSGDRIFLADGEGREYLGTILHASSGTIAVQVQEQSPAVSGTTPRITLYQGLPKTDKMELILQKATELGVSRVVAFPAERSVTKLDRERAADRVRRWQKIVLEAARQSNRASVPDVALVESLAAALAEPGGEVNLLLWEEETETRLRDILASPAPHRVSVIVGPEGGLSRNEVGAARQSGYTSVSLGKRILRAETASLALLAIVQHCWGDLG
jgi:16S rRNA (uracil1498-N3)-methyltransferase